MKRTADELLEAIGGDRLSQCAGVRGLNSGEGATAASERTRQAGAPTRDDDDMRTPTWG